MNNFIENHSKQTLEFLLCGKMPLISNKKSKKIQKKINFEEEKKFDFSKLPPKIELIESERIIKKNKKPKQNLITSSITSRKFNKIQQEIPLFNNCKENLKLYEENHERKIYKIQHDFEEHFFKPFQNRLSNSLNNKDYNNFKKNKNKAITSLGPIPILSTISKDEPIEIPYLKISTIGLKDETKNYIKNNKLEKNLTKKIQINEGSFIPEISIPPRDTCDFNKWKCLSETRVYNFSSKGTKIFENKFKSIISKELNSF